MNSSNIERGTVASQTEVWKIWKDLLSKRVGCTVVIDGFDEFDRTYRVQSKFLQKIKQVATQTTTNILITSRNEEDIQHALSPSPRDTSEILMLECLVSKELVRGDLNLLASEVINDVLHSKSEEVKKDLASRLAVRSDGMFLWIKQQNMGQLRPGKPLKQLQQMVDRMPSGLKETYRKIWDEIEKRQHEDKERTLGILRLIAFAFRPLTVAEVTEALLVKPDYDSLNLDEWPDAIDEEYIKSEIKGLCGSLIDIRSPGRSDVPGSRTLHLAHISVKEFLVEELCTRTAKEDSEAKKLREHHTELAKVCLRYLTYPEIWQPKLASDQGFPRSFLTYASAWWERHVSLGDELDDDVSKCVAGVLHPDIPAFHEWRASRIDSVPNLPPPAKEALKTMQGNPLVWASQFGLKGQVENLLSSRPDLVHQREYQTALTPLHTACGSGSLDLIKLLLEKGAELDSQSSGKRTPLIYGVIGGKKENVSYLLDVGADINTQDYSGRTPLCHACISGRSDIAMLLLDRGADPTIADNDRCSPLHALCRNGDGDPTPIVRLIEKGADTTINLKTTDGDTCLHACAWYNWSRIATILFENGAKQSLYSEFVGQAPIHFAASNGCQEMLQLLIKQHRDINVKSSENMTPLHIATLMNHSTVVKLLLENGAFIEATDQEGRTPLLLAALNSHIGVVELLLANGANDKSCDKRGWSLLHYAAVTGLFDLVKKLVGSGTDPNVTTHDGLTPSYVAASNGHMDVMEYLIREAARVQAVPGKGNTAPFMATKDGDANAVASHLDHWTQVKAKNRWGYEPLHDAAFHNRPEVVRLLIDRGADPNVSSASGFRPLHLAASQGHLEVAKRLLERGAKLSVDDVSGSTPLHRAAVSGHSRIVELLLEHGADISTRFLGLTPLALAVQQENKDAIQVLLEYKADWTSVVGGTRSIIHWAAWNSSTGVFSLLLNVNQDFDVLMKGPWSLLNNAAHGGKIENLKILLGKRPIEDFKPDFEGRTALHLAARGGKLAAFEMLLYLGCNPIAKDSRGRNILHYASMGSSLELIERTLQLPCSADLLEQESRFTPLHWAAASGNPQVMAALVAAGLEETAVKANFPKRTSEWTPSALAKFFSNEKLLSDTECLFKLRDSLLDVVPGKRYYSYTCDSCENVSFFTLSGHYQS